MHDPTKHNYISIDKLEEQIYDKDRLVILVQVLIDMKMWKYAHRITSRHQLID